jgi:RNA polymerase sigma-70 factor (ECF subfamily)
MISDARIAAERALRFRDAALPCLDDAYRLAHFLMRNQADAEDAVQECYLRALRNFDSLRGPAVRPWLLAILRNVCYAELARRGRGEPPGAPAYSEYATVEPLWQEPSTAPDAAIRGQEESATIRELVAALPAPLHEAIVLREFNDMSYREIAEVAGVPIGTVMSRLSRARAMLLAGWKARDEPPQQPLTLRPVVDPREERDAPPPMRAVR